jgi:hypothetical protein
MIQDIMYSLLEPMPAQVIWPSCHYDTILAAAEYPAPWEAMAGQKPCQHNTPARLEAYLEICASRRRNGLIMGSVMHLRSTEPLDFEGQRSILRISIL